MANVVKDIGEIWTRLFDHRPFLSGEIKFFLYEFEEKRDNREVDTLFQILQNLTEIKDSQLDKIKLGSEAHLQPLKKKVDDSIKICSRIFEKEETYKSKESYVVLQVIPPNLEVFPVIVIMSDNIGMIKDPTIQIKPSEKLVNFLQENSKAVENSNELPENLKHIIKNKEALLKVSDIEWLNEFLINCRNAEKTDLLSGKELYNEIDRLIENKYSGFDFNGFLEEKNKNETYLHELMSGSELILPKNESIERNPVLAKRIERLKKEQEDREYKEMTKNVNMNRKHFPEDSISYQMNMMNRHLIAVLQFLISVGAGFAFGFIGLELVVGELNFGVRLLLGIAFALTIAIAEFYFLAKHLNEEEKQEANETEKSKLKPTAVKTKAKLHAD